MRLTHAHLIDAGAYVCKRKSKRQELQTEFNRSSQVSQLPFFIHLKKIYPKIEKGFQKNIKMS